MATGQSPIKSLAPLALVYATKGIDFANNETALLYLRMGFVAVQLLTLALNLYILRRVDEVKDTRKFKQGDDETTNHEHDRKHALEALQGQGASIVIVGGIHWKLGYFMPLLMVSATALLNYVDGPHRKLFEAYALMKPVERPFANPKALPFGLEEKKKEIEARQKADKEKAEKAASGGKAKEPSSGGSTKKSKKAD